MNEYIKQQSKKIDEQRSTKERNNEQTHEQASKLMNERANK